MCRSVSSQRIAAVGLVAWHEWIPKEPQTMDRRLEADCVHMKRWVGRRTWAAACHVAGNELINQAVEQDCCLDSLLRVETP